MIKHYINLFNIPSPFCHHAIFFKWVFVYKGIEAKGKLKTLINCWVKYFSLSSMLFLCVRKRGRECVRCPLNHSYVISLRKQDKHLKQPWKIMSKKSSKVPEAFDVMRSWDDLVAHRWPWLWRIREGASTVGAHLVLSGEVGFIITEGRKLFKYFS